MWMCRMPGRIPTAVIAAAVLGIIAAVVTVEVFPAGGRASSVVPANPVQTVISVQSGQEHAAVVSVSKSVGFSVLEPAGLPPGFKLVSARAHVLGSEHVAELLYTGPGSTPTAPVALEIQEWNIRLKSPAEPGNGESDVLVDVGVPWAQVWEGPGQSRTRSTYTIFAGSRTYDVLLFNAAPLGVADLRQFVAPFQPR